eukprot:1475984-Rhodomonas_salina.1
MSIEKQTRETYIEVAAAVGGACGVGVSEGVGIKVGLHRPRAHSFLNSDPVVVHLQHTHHAIGQLRTLAMVRHNKQPAGHAQPIDRTRLTVGR